MCSALIFLISILFSSYLITYFCPLTSTNLGFNDTSNQNIVSLKIKKGWVEVKCVVKNNKLGIFNDIVFARYLIFLDINFAS